MEALTAGGRPPLWRLVWNEVRQDFISLRASALAFQTLASWLPLLAITLAVLSGPAFEKQRERILDRLAVALVPPVQDAPFQPDHRAGQLPGVLLPGEDELTQADMQEQFKQKFRDTIQLMAANLSAISTFSFLALLVIAGLLYRTAEETFNAIWKVRSGRSIFMKIAIVTVFVFWGPVFFFLSLSLADNTSTSILGRWLVPTMLTGIGFTAFYMIMPNARVRFGAAMAGGIFGAVLWELGKQGFLIYVTYAVGFSKVYGSLGLVPMIFAWVYLSWMVILAGAELAYIIQHHQAMAEQWELRQRQARGLAVVMDEAQREAAQRPALALAAACEIACLFITGTVSGGVRRSELAERLGVETGPLGRALERLVQGGILVEVAGGRMDLVEQDPRYLPARDPGTCGMDVVLRACKGDECPAGSGASWERARDLMERMNRDGLSSTARMTLAEACRPPACEERKGDDSDETVPDPERDPRPGTATAS